MESCFSQIGRMHYPNCFLLCNHKIMNKNCTLQKFFAISFKYHFVSHHLLSMHSFVRVLEERYNHNQSKLAKNFYSDYWLKIFLLSSPKLCLTSPLPAKQTMSDGKQHWVSWPRFIFSFILFWSVCCVIILSKYKSPSWFKNAYNSGKSVPALMRNGTIHLQGAPSASLLTQVSSWVQGKMRKEGRIFSDGLSSLHQLSQVITHR